MRLSVYKQQPGIERAIHIPRLCNLRTWLPCLAASIVLMLLLAPAAPVLPQDNLLPPSAQDLSLPQQVLTGWINVVHGDPQPGSGQAYREEVLLTDERGKTLAELAMDAETAEHYFGREVQVTGGVIAASNGGRVPRVTAEAIQPLQSGQQLMQANDVSGSQPWVNLLCRFPNVPGVPRQPADYAPLFSSTYPGLDHYWRQTSYNNIDLEGTTTISQWVVMPLPRAAYFNANGDADLGKLVVDCTDAADDAIYFLSFVGINMMFNDVLDCCAWGGSTTIRLDGEIKTYRTTWLPPWSQVYNAIAHEMGHGFGFPHSTGPADDPPSDLNIYISDWDVMSSSDGTCRVADPQPPNGFGCYPVGTIAYNLASDGWITPNRSPVVDSGQTSTVTLEQVQLPVSTTNPLLVRVPVSHSSNHFYTVEARFDSGYDQNSPAAAVNGAVLIHDVDNVKHTGNGGYAYVVDDLELLSPLGCVLHYLLPLPLGCNDLNDNVNDDGAMWTVGETFTDAVNNISVSVLSKGSSSFTVRIANGSLPPPEAPTNLRITNTTVDTATLTWQDNSNSEDGFKIYKWETCNGTMAFCLKATVGVDVTTYTDHALPCNKVIYYQVTSYNTKAESDATPYAYATTDPCSATNIAPPVNYFPTGSTVLTWNAVSGATHYEVQIGTDAAFRNSLVDGGTFEADTYSAAFTLHKGTYYWRVRAQGGTGTWGAWSAPQSITVNG